MTAKEFDSLTDPEDVWEVFEKHTGYRGRKRVLAAVALSGMLSHLLKNPQTLRAIELLDQFAELPGTTEQWAEAAVEAEEGAEFCTFRRNATDAQSHAATAVSKFAQLLITWGMQISKNALASEADKSYGKKYTATQKAVAKSQCQVLREILGNPFRPVVAPPEWLTSTVVAIAQGCYSSRDFGPLPILADALQDAGCDAEAILGHCREPGDHVRGCWVVDLLLKKS